MQWIVLIAEWFTGTGIYQFCTELAAYLVEWYVIGVINAKIFLAQFAWDVASNIMANLGLSSLIQQTWSNLDSRFLSYATFFRIPEAVNIILQAFVTKFTLRVIS